MRTVIHDKVSQRIVNLVLRDTAHSLTGHDLLKITEMAEQAHAVVHVSYGSWQVLVGVPECSYDLIAADLQAMGYECGILAGEIDGVSTFVINGVDHEASL
jgi:hypothetical protein